MSNPNFKRGAKKAPRHKLLAVDSFKPKKETPANFAVVPKQLSVWGNDQYGDCVSAEEAFAKVCYSEQCRLTEDFATDQEVISWARQHGFLDGADLPEVMDAMARDGLDCSTGVKLDGGYKGVDYSNEATLQAALTVGPVKIAIDANALPSDAGNKQGWYSTNTHHFGNTDHCVALCGYGTADFLFKALGVPLPTNLDGSIPGYLLFTWGTIGFVTHGWLMGTCTEAYVRLPTTVGESPAPQPEPTPGPGPAPAPQPTLIQLLELLAEWLISLFKHEPHTKGLTPGQWLAIVQMIIAFINQLVNPPSPPQKQVQSGV